MRGRGLKQKFNAQNVGYFDVAPHAGAWIETLNYGQPYQNTAGRPPCGGVD